MKVLNVTDASFRKYGKVLKGYDYSGILEEMQNTPVPEDVTYVPSLAALESAVGAEAMADKVYGGMPIQIGYCNGHNKALNALEYHRDSEIDIAATDLILMLGCEQDVEDDFTYDTAKVEAFLVPAGTAVELYATTLHYAPCHVDEAGFRCVVVLPKNTNTDIEIDPEATGEDRLLFARNKWLVAHEDAAIGGAFNGLRGENITLD
ncbi:MAG: DUF4867 family protein [Blautia sp.]|nr:DUF4867 family protein [Blautia sp.]